MKTSLHSEHVQELVLLQTGLTSNVFQCSAILGWVGSTQRILQLAVRPGMLLAAQSQYSRSPSLPISRLPDMGSNTTFLQAIVTKEVNARLLNTFISMSLALHTEMSSSRSKLMHEWDWLRKHHVLKAATTVTLQFSQERVASLLGTK